MYFMLSVSAPKDMHLLHVVGTRVLSNVERLFFAMLEVDMKLQGRLPMSAG